MKFNATECPDLKYSLCQETFIRTNDALVPGKYVTTDQVDYTCETSEFCDKSSDSGTARCALATKDGIRFAIWEDAPSCDRTAIEDLGWLIFIYKNTSIE